MNKKSTSKKVDKLIDGVKPVKKSNPAPAVKSEPIPDPTDAISEKSDAFLDESHPPPTTPPPAHSAGSQRSAIAEPAPIQPTPPARSWNCSCGAVNPFDHSRNAQVCPICGFDYPNSILSPQ